MRRSLRIVITLAIMAIFATGAYAFTAQNTVHSSNVGSGSGVIGAYTVSNIAYDLSGDQLVGVDFVLTANSPGNPASDVQVEFDGGTSNVYNVDNSSCTIDSATPQNVSCTVAENAVDVTGLIVSAAQ